MAKYSIDNTTLTNIANPIRTLRGLSVLLTPDEMASNAGVVQTNVTAALAALAEKGVTVPDGANSDDLETLIRKVASGGGGALNFYDYDGTLLYSYTVEEAAALAELPPLPSHDGLICQGWNWTLDKIKAMGGSVNVGALYITDDGKTRIYITLHDGRTSPLLGCCPNGTVTVDWGDGTEPDVLTGTSTSTVQWTPTHEYAASGDYVITLTVDGTMGFYGSTSEYSGILRYARYEAARNKVYQNAIHKVEIGSGVTSIGSDAFNNCYSLSSIAIPDSVTSIGSQAFYRCASLSSIAIPDGVTSIGSQAFNSCYSLSSIAIPDSVTSIGIGAFYGCPSLSSITIPDSVTSIGRATFYSCYSLSSIAIPGSVASIDSYAFNNCASLSSIAIHDGVTSIGSYAFDNCYGLSSITIPDSVTSIDSYAFRNCNGVRYYDFIKHTSVPTLSNGNAFDSISADCEIRVPAALADEWKAATNWSTYAQYIVGV